jgi:2-haloacid dehalogenase
MKAVVFDAYGTLFDVQSVLAECERLFPGRGAEVSRLWRQKQLEYSWLRSLMDRYAPFDQVTEDALRHACAALGLALDAEGSAALMAAYRRLTPYPEVPGALTALAGRSLAILSNGSPSMLDDVVRNAGLEHHFEAVLSVHPRRVFKPHPSVYQSAVDRLEVSVADVAFVSSNFWDIAGATAFGFRTFWINRAGMAADQLGVAPTGVLHRLDQLPGLLA